MSRRSSLPSWYEPAFLWNLPLFVPQYASSHLPSDLSPLSDSSYPYTLLILLFIHLASQGSPSSHSSEELLKQPDYSDKIKQMLGNPQGQPWGLGEGACCGVGGKQGVVSRDSAAGWEGKTGQSVALPSWSERAREAHLSRQSSHSSRVLLLYFFFFFFF